MVDILGFGVGSSPGLDGPLADASQAGRTVTPEADSTDIVPSSVEGEASTAVLAQAEGAAELVNQEGTAGVARGVPIENDEERPNLDREHWRRGRARIRTLTDLFGPDALILGHLLFKVPPLAIRVKKGNITYRWKPLRTRDSIAVKSGNGECYIEVDLAFVGLSQIGSSLSELVALWNSVPFCFIENVHIRKMMVPERPDESMAVCLETLVMDAVAGTPNTVYATLILKWFNYGPYSQNFWFRRDWLPAEGVIPQPNPTTGGQNAPTDIGENEGGAASPIQGRVPSTVLVDISAIENPSTLSAVVRDHPPEVGLFESVQVDNPGDPTMSGTYPVVYPFNSQPFLDHVRRVGRPVRVNSWSDGLTMNWNRFVRMPVPTSWQYGAESSGSTAVSASQPRPRSAAPGRSLGGPAADASVPVAVTGDRDVVIFLGDTFMVGFTAQSQVIDTAAATVDDPFFQWVGNTTFPSSDGFTYYGIMRIGADSSEIRSWWNSSKNKDEFKAEGDSASCSRVAGVVIHSGTYDGDIGPNLSVLGEIMNEVSGYGAIPILLCLPPGNDADHLNPPLLSSLKTVWAPAAVDAYYQAIVGHHAGMSRLADDTGNGMLIDYHPEIVDAAFRGSRSAPLGEEYMIKDSPSSGYYEIEWNSSGYTAAGNYIKGLLPWNSLRGQPTPVGQDSNNWTVCYVEDGDTVWVWGTHPDDSSRTVLRNVRMKFLDTPETYHEFENTDHNVGGSRAFPKGQDSYRPDNMQYGEIATNALTAELPAGTLVTVTWHGTGAYGRYLGEIFKNGNNLNLEMVRQGYGLANIARNPNNEMQEQEVGFNYWLAEEEAKGINHTGTTTGLPNSPRGIWAQTEVQLIDAPAGLTTEDRNALTRFMDPVDFRRDYRPSTDGGHGGTPVTCTQAEREVAGDNQGEDVGP